MTAEPLDAAPAVAGPRGFAAYGVLLRCPQVARLLAGSLLGRAQLGMASLAILLVVHDETGSFADAGVAVGLFGGSAPPSTPVLGRLVDRLARCRARGHRRRADARVRRRSRSGARHGAVVGALLGLCRLAGVALPPLSSSMRALWPVLVPEPTLREAAYTLDAIVQELIWTLGPLLVAVFVAVWSASAALCSSAPPSPPPASRCSSPRRSRVPGARSRAPLAARAAHERRIRLLLACIAIASLGTGVCQVAIPAIGVRAGSSAVGRACCSGSGASAACSAAIAFGARALARAGRDALPAAVRAMAAVDPAAGGCALRPGRHLLCAFLAGLPLAALISCQYTLVSARRAPRDDHRGVRLELGRRVRGALRRCRRRRLAGQGARARLGVRRGGAGRGMAAAVAASTVRA